MFKRDTVTIILCFVTGSLENNKLYPITSTLRTLNVTTLRLQLFIWTGNIFFQRVFFLFLDIIYLNFNGATINSLMLKEDLELMLQKKRKNEKELSDRKINQL